MGTKCPKCPPEGAPEWMMTYGDMMTLLLCFFVILVSLSEIKDEKRFKAVVREVQKAFGMKGGGGLMATISIPASSMTSRLNVPHLQRKKLTEVSNSDDPGVDGRDARVTKVREGERFVVGGRITFEPGEAKLSRTSKNDLLKIARLVKGFNTKLEISGHASSGEVAAVSMYPDLMTLSYARANVVMRFLTSEKVGIRSERIRIIANADKEPIKKKVWTWSQQQPNRRVEIYVVESLVRDFNRSETN